MKQQRPPKWRLTSERLVVVSGKGGVGRSTVAAALGLAASRCGLRTIVAEVAGCSDVARLLGCQADGDSGVARLCPGLDCVTIERHAALEEYLRSEVPGWLPSRILGRSKMFELFVDAAPGLGELLTIGKVWDLARRGVDDGSHRPYDLVVLDGPASGQIVGLLTAPRTFGAITRVGPVARQAAAIERSLEDRGAVRVLAVTTAEQMAVSETLDLRATLARELGIDFAAVVVNRLFPARFSARDAATLAHAGDDPAVRTARWSHARARAQRAQLARLRRGLGEVRCTTLPFLFRDEFDRAAVELLASRIDRSLL